MAARTATKSAKAPVKASVKKAAAKRPAKPSATPAAKTTPKPASKNAAKPTAKSKLPKAKAKTVAAKSAPAGARPTARISVDEVLGQIVRILSVSPDHRAMALGDLQHRVAPPLRLGQCRVLRGAAGQPIAYAAWARVSDDVHKRLEAGERTLKPEEWNSGPHPWLIDLAAPPQALPQVLAELQAKVFKGEVVRTVMARSNL